MKPNTSILVRRLANTNGMGLEGNQVERDFARLTRSKTGNVQLPKNAAKKAKEAAKSP